MYLMETIDNIQKGELVFEDQIWENYSKSVKDLINRFLKPRAERMTAEEAKKHVWFSSEMMTGEKVNE